MKILKIGYFAFGIEEGSELIKALDILDKAIKIDDKWCDGKKYWVVQDGPDIFINTGKITTQEDFDKIEAAYRAKKAAENAQLEHVEES